MKNPEFRLVVLISGNGSNLQAIINAIQQDQLDAKIVLVVSNKAAAFGLERAHKANIATKILPDKDYPTREAYDIALKEIIEHYKPDLIILAGFMRILSASLVRHFKDKIINIHPSLLPKYKGLNTHQRVLEAGDKIHGVTVHYVTDELDGGPIIAQASLEVAATDTAEELKVKIHQLEHELYPKVIQALKK